MSSNSKATLDVASYTRTAHDAWSAFMRARLDAHNAPAASGSVHDPEGMIKIELGLLQHYTAIAKQRQNALRPAGRLPGELLAMIFTQARSSSGAYADGWVPSRRLVEVDMPGEKPSAGGEKKTCLENGAYIPIRAENKAAFHNHSLWQDINCFTLPVRAVPVIVPRAGTLPLRIKARETSVDEIGEADLGTWLSGPLLRRAEVLELSTYSEGRLDEWTPYLLQPLRHLRELSLSAGEEAFPAMVQEGLFARQRLPELRSLSLYNCFPDWTSPFFSANLTHLSLKTPYVFSNSGAEDSFPTKSDFQRMLSSMLALESLDFEEFLPGQPDAIDVPSPTTYTFPPNFRSLRVRCQSMTVLTNGLYIEFFAECSLPATVVLIVDVSMGDLAMEEDEEENTLGAYLAPVTQVHIVETQSPTELMLGHGTIALRLETTGTELPWALCQSPSECSSPSSVARNSSLPVGISDVLWNFVPEQWASGCVRGGRLWRCNWVNIAKYITFLPLPSINILSLLPNSMSFFPTEETWLKHFETARQVERISASYLRCIYLLSALTRVHDNTGNPSLFPHLSTIVFVAETHPLVEHQALRSAVDMYLKDVLIIRREAGAPIQYIYVDRRMSSWEIWAEVDSGTVISFFE